VHRAVMVAAAIKVLPRLATLGRSCCSHLLSSAAQGEAASCGATGEPGLDVFAMGSYRRGAHEHGDIDFVMVPPPGAGTVLQRWEELRIVTLGGHGATENAP
jgi:poly(A) polymerase Pap1